MANICRHRFCQTDSGLDSDYEYQRPFSPSYYQSDLVNLEEDLLTDFVKDIPKNQFFSEFGFWKCPKALSVSRRDFPRFEVLTFSITQPMFNTRTARLNDQ